MPLTVRKPLVWRTRVSFERALPVLVLVAAAALRLWALARPDELVFDELYYVRDAVSQLAHGYPTVWPDDDPGFGGERASAFSDVASGVAHPPLGKWLIGLGVLLFGVGDGWGWRLAVALSGVATVAITMRLGHVLTGSALVGSLAGAVLALDGVHVVLSRVSLLDGPLTMLIVLGALFISHDRASARSPVWRRPWLIAAGLTFGCAAAVKWSGVYAFAAFLVLITLRELIERRRISSVGSWLGTARWALVTGTIALPTAALAYLASWAGWILNPGGHSRIPGEPWWVSLGEWHVRMLTWHSTLSAEHPFQSHPITWPLGLRPTTMYRELVDQGSGCIWTEGCVSAVTPIPNPVVTWGGALALLLLGWIAVRALWRAGRFRSLAPLARPGLWAIAVILTGYLSGLVPWLLTPGRSAVFQFYAVVLTPFSALALALVLGALSSVDGGSLMRLAGWRLDASRESVRGRRISVVLVMAVALVLAVLFFPLWSGMPVAEWFYRAHLWLPGWR